MNSRNYPAKIVRVVDGDTVALDVDTGFHNRFAYNFRLNGINAPEGKSLAGVRLSEMLYPGREVTVTTWKADKYGRWLADITIPNLCPSVCRLLLDEGLAVPYAGGAR
jgi:endonuclease YncB( thermonuclease family)